ncbi:hypothetical protein HZF08_02600 [Paenibacillus sp. CGMCC 1.16610]|uniref:Uncharacterized protein n=1 Tax=Paenibacillus anseongense TaxID=2682845 RepID=A0ABW9U806_9BACL|nr:MULTISPECIES: hypothetical protein [Paenibacillus]MBA2937182.1 hypothetical protein [Paenibacillus sp. CGMCC 1.16610]MVQ36244.1 hypothetical protein [Paenibacillus anseongense]
MSKKLFKLIANIITLCSIGYVIYIGYFVFFDKPVTPEDITKIYSKMGYAYVSLAVILITRALLRKYRIL